jgi:hypothetical protein
MNNHNSEGLRAIINPQLSDRLYTLAAEYSTSTDLLIHLAVKRLIDDIDLLRKLRTGEVTLE